MSEERPPTAPGPATPDADGSVLADGSAATNAAPPNRRAAIFRSGLIIGVLFVVFVVILPRYIDYQEVVAAFQGLQPWQFLVMTVLGMVAWFVSGLIFSALVPGLSALRGTESWLILSGIGSSVPFGPGTWACFGS